MDIFLFLENNCQRSYKLSQELLRFGLAKYFATESKVHLNLYKNKLQFGQQIVDLVSTEMYFFNHGKKIILNENVFRGEAI